MEGGRKKRWEGGREEGGKRGRKEGRKREGGRKGEIARGKEEGTRESPGAWGFTSEKGGFLGDPGVVDTWLRRLCREAPLSSPSPLRVGDILQTGLRVP